jgi:hypothetical protein
MYEDDRFLHGPVEIPEFAFLKTGTHKDPQKFSVGDHEPSSPRSFTTILYQLDALDYPTFRAVAGRKRLACTTVGEALPAGVAELPRC